jgi:tellurite resistance protein TerC
VPASTDITIWHWAAFATFVLIALALDLGLFHRKARVISIREAAGWTLFWIAVSISFALWVAPRSVSGWNSSHTTQFITGYVVELSLSMDNVFVIAVLFSYFRVPQPWQHRVLFWGILGAMVMRGALIWAGAELIGRFHWILYIMGLFLVVTGVKMLLSASDGGHQPDPQRNPLVRLLQRFFPLSRNFDGEKFITRENGRRALTPLAVVLVMVETTDVVFALDSIPAIFGVTQEPFIVFTSNVFAILGLRSLYFVLASAMRYFRFLKYGLSVVLISIGFRMLAEKWLRQWLGDHVTNISLGFVVAVLVLSMLASLMMAPRETADTSGREEST